MNWGQHINFLNDKGISISGNQLSRADAFEAIWLAVSSPVAKDNKILGVELGKLDANLFEPQVKNLAINSVSANNLKEIIVAFNQPVNKDKIGEFKIKGFSSYKLLPELTEDPSVVKLVASNFSFRDQKEYTLIMNKVNAENSKVDALGQTEMKFVPLDRERPEVENIEFTGSKHLTITFSEPIWAKGELVIKQGGTTTVAPNLAKYTPDGSNVAVIPLVSDLKEGKEYSILVKKFYDFSGKESINKEVTLTYNKATDAPTAEIVGATPEYVRVRFSRPVKGLEPKLFHHTYSTWNAVSIKKMDDSNITKRDIVHEAKIVFYMGSTTHHSLPEGIVKFMIEGDTIKDLYGNKLGNVEDKVSVNVDSEKPVVEKCELEEGGKIKVVFSKPMDIKSTDYKKVFVVESKGKSVFKSATPTVGKNDTEFIIQLKNINPGDSLTIKINHAKDKTVNGNELVPFENTIKYADTKGPSIKKAAVQIGNYNSDEVPNPGSFLYVFFDREVSGDYALDAANYQLNKGGVYKTLTGEVSFFETSDVVKIQLSKKESDLVEDEGYNKLFVDKVTDLEGFPITNKYVSLNAFGDVNTFKPEKYTLKNDRQLEITFTQNITDYSQNKSDYILSSGDLTVDRVSCEPGTKVLTLTLKKNQSFISSDPGKLENTKLTIKENSLLGSFGNANKEADIKDVDIITGDKANVAGGVEDKINPQVKVVAAAAGRHFYYDADENLAYAVNVGTAPAKEIVMEFTRKLAVLDGAKANEQLGEAIKVSVGDTVLNNPKGEVSFAIDSGNKVKITINGDYEGQVVIEPNNLSLLTVDGNNKLPVKFDSMSSTEPDGATLKELDFMSPQVVKVETKAVEVGTSVTIHITFDKPIAAVAGGVAAGDVTLNAVNSTAQEIVADTENKVVSYTFAIANYDVNKELVVVAKKFKFSDTNFENHAHTYKLKVKGATPADDDWEFIKKN